MSNLNNVPLKGAAPAGSPGSYTSKEQIVALLKGTDPAAVSRAGQSYVSFAGAYEQMVANLKGFSNELAEAWTGPASNAAQAQLLDMHEAAMQIFQQSDSAGRAVQAHGDSYLSWYHSSMPTPKSIQEAQQWMQAANSRIIQTYNAMPDSLTTKLPPASKTNVDDWLPPGDRSSGSGGGPGSGPAGNGGPGGGDTRPHSTAGGSGYRPSVSTPDSHPHHGGGNEGQNVPGHGPGHGSPTRHPDGNGQPGQWWPDGGGGPHRTDLSSYDPSGGGPGATGPGFGAGPSGAGGGPGSFPVSGGGPGAGSVPGIGVVPGPGIGSGLGGGAGRGVLGTGGLGANATGRSGTSGVAGVPGHGSGEDKNRERNRGAWLAEERSLWDGDVESVPGLIGEEAPRAAETETDAEQSATEVDPAVLLQAALARIVELEARNADQSPASDPPLSP
ncbi:WXG100 family type VII secretion target [Actinomadura gamaensis]|uniref:WXG100 family type VII secretion target n=1 Tax=Actinomadura gamaensis TaxID=1763541 RepID=A0ABV9U861_9ACTN